jgi:V/A-type H+/Na+-transporting ATPase subunit I
VELPSLLKARRYMDWLHDKQAAREAMGETVSTVTLLGWVPRKQIPRLERRLQHISPAIAILRIKPEEGEEPPILLRHWPFIAPFVSVTSLYGLPRPTDMDPTPVLSPFFILFFALCLTDAGYGLTLAVIFGVTLWIRKKSVTQSPLLWLLFISGIMSVLVGILFGGYFGLTPEQVPGALTTVTPSGELWFRGQLWNLSQQTGVTFLQNLALVLGLTHLFLGMFLAGFHKWMHGRKIEAFWADFSSHILLGVILFRLTAPADLQEVAQYLLYAGIAIMIWGKGYGNPWYLRPIIGLIGLLNFTISMLSNGLSYLRLLALGLVTGAMAMAVNQVAVEMGNLFPIWLAIPIIIIVFLVGHLVSIALNTLGSFIHAGRLQFIEFFSQFFEGGGRPFTPFRRSPS